MILTCATRTRECLDGVLSVRGRHKTCRAVFTSTAGWKKKKTEKRARGRFASSCIVSISFHRFRIWNTIYFSYIFRSLFLIYNWRYDATFNRYTMSSPVRFFLSCFFFHLYYKNKWNNLIIYITNLHNIKMLIYSYRYYN